MPETTLDIYNRLVAGEKVRVRFESKLRFEVLRTELCRYHRVNRDLLSLSDGAICSHFADNVGSFHIGLPTTGKTIQMKISTENTDGS